MQRPGSEAIAELALALEFLTRVPFGGPDLYTSDRWARMPRWFGFAGLLIGLAAAGMLGLAALVFPQGLAVWIMLAGMVLLTGGLHEDGLADSADGLGGGHNKARALEIMRDSRIGSYGVLVLIFAFGLQASSLTALPLQWALAAIILAHTISRAGLTLALGQGRYLRDAGAGKGLDKAMTRTDAALGLATLALALIGAVALKLPAGAVLIAMLAGVGTGVLWLGFARRKIGGDTGDTLGAMQVISATATLVGAAAWA